MAKMKLGILVSGSGTNLQAVLDAVARGTLAAEVGVVISNEPTARALERAKAARVPTRVISHREFPDRAVFERHLLAALREADVSHVVLAGFMRILGTEALLQAFPWRVINIHPALLPAFPGIRGQRQALAYGVKIAGCTVHYVDAGTDSGPVIAQAVVPVLDDDTEEALTARILEQENRLLVAVLQAIADGQVEVVAGEAGGRPRVRTHDLSSRMWAEARA